MNNYQELSNPNLNSEANTNIFRSFRRIILVIALSIIILFLLALFFLSKTNNTNSFSQPPVDGRSRIISIPVILSPVTSILPTAYTEKSISPTTIPSIIPALSTNIIPRGNIKVAVIEFKFKDELKSDYYEYYCKSNDCIFRSPDQDNKYFSDWCGKNCNIFQKSFYTIFNNPEGITNIYPPAKNQAKYSYYSIYQVKNFYENEAKKYGVDLNIALEVKGPFILADKPPQRLRDQSPSFLEDFFDNEARKNSVDISHYDIINYLYFTSENYLVATTNKNKTFNQVFISFNEFFGGIQTVIHEMGHTFGAYDTYQPGSWPCEYPEGFPEPDKTPLYPQSKACLMCKSVMLAEKTTRGPADFDEIIVCETEAKRFGWK